MPSFFTSFQPLPVESQVTAVAVILNYSHYAERRRQRHQSKEIQKMKTKIERSISNTFGKHMKKKNKKKKAKDSDDDDGDDDVGRGGNGVGDGGTTDTTTFSSTTSNFVPDQADTDDYYQYHAFFDVLLADGGVAEHFTAYHPSSEQQQISKSVVDTSDMKALLLQVRDPAHFFGVQTARKNNQAWFALVPPFPSRLTMTNKDGDSTAASEDDNSSISSSNINNNSHPQEDDEGKETPSSSSASTKSSQCFQPNAAYLMELAIDYLEEVIEKPEIAAQLPKYCRRPHTHPHKTMTSTPSQQNKKEKKQTEKEEETESGDAVMEGEPPEVLPLNVELMMRNSSSSSSNISTDSDEKGSKRNFKLMNPTNLVWKQCKSLTTLRIPTGPIREYFGDEVNIYFEWMNTYNTWLLFPAFFGLFVQFSYHFLFDDMPILHPLFSFAMLFWGVAFVKCWGREAARYGADHRMLAWGNGDSGGGGGGMDGGDDEVSLTDSKHVRKGFRGTRRISPITDLPELHFSSMRRLLCKQTVSWLLITAFLSFCIFVQVCSLNLQGYMRRKDDTHSGIQHEALEISFFDQFSHPGRIFDPDSGSFILPLIPVALHCTTVLCLNLVFRQIARALTEWENWKYDEEFHHALIIKRIFFEFIDCYAVLFYVAFYRLDMVQLRLEFMSLYSVDQIRRTLMETVIPFLMSHRRDVTRHVSSKKKEKTQKMVEKNTESANTNTKSTAGGVQNKEDDQDKEGEEGALLLESIRKQTSRGFRAVDDEFEQWQGVAPNPIPLRPRTFLSDQQQPAAVSDNGNSNNSISARASTTASSSAIIPSDPAPEGEDFDDYLEMVMQFGYVTLFAAAFPLAGFFSLLCNWIEIRSDLFKVCFVNRRPKPKRVCNIGAWHQVLKLFAFTAVMTNVLLIGFTSQYQMSYYFPQFYEGQSSGQQQFYDIGAGAGGAGVDGDASASSSSGASSSVGGVSSAGVITVNTGSIMKNNNLTHPNVSAVNNRPPVIKSGEGRFVVGTIFTVEHCLMLAVLILYSLVPAVPLDVVLQIQRQKYKKFIDAKEQAFSRRRTEATTKLWKTAMGTLLDSKEKQKK